MGIKVKLCETAARSVPEASTCLSCYMKVFSRCVCHLHIICLHVNQMQHWDRLWFHYNYQPIATEINQSWRRCSYDPAKITKIISMKTCILMPFEMLYFWTVSIENLPLSCVIRREGSNPSRRSPLGRQSPVMEQSGWQGHGRHVIKVLNDRRAVMSVLSV